MDTYTYNKTHRHWSFFFSQALDWSPTMSKMINLIGVVPTKLMKKNQRTKRGRQKRIKTSSCACPKIPLTLHGLYSSSLLLSWSPLRSPCLWCTMAELPWCHTTCSYGSHGQRSCGALAWRFKSLLNWFLGQSSVSLACCVLIRPKYCVCDLLYVKLYASYLGNVITDDDNR